MDPELQDTDPIEDHIVMDITDLIGDTGDGTMDIHGIDGGGTIHGFGDITTDLGIIHQYMWVEG